MGAFSTLQQAYERAEPNTRIKLAPDVYNETIIVKKPGLVFEPIDKELDVTIRQESRPCFVIDIGPEEVCTINNFKMMLCGPNKELDMKAYQETVHFDSYGSQNCITEFYVRENMYCLVLVKSGILKMNKKLQIQEIHVQ